MDKVIKNLESIDKEELEIIDMLDKLSGYMADRHRWNNKQKKAIKMAMGYLSQCLGNVEHIEIGPTPASTWKKINDE